MRIRHLLALSLALGIAATLQAQPTTPPASQSQTVLADGDPPLTQDMADRYLHFMRWALRTPLTLAQEARIQSFLIDNWKADNTHEISRTLNILALRDQISDMHLSDSAWAAFTTGTDAMHNWKRSPSLEMAQWGIATFNSSHTPLVVDTPPLTRQMDEAYEELGYFMMNEVDGAPPIKLDAMERSQLADALGGNYKTMTADQKANFALIPKIWVQIRTAWPTLDDASKEALRAQWKAHFYPESAKPKTTPPAKGAKPTKPSKPAPAPQMTHPDPVIVRLVKMTWVTNPDVFSKLTATGSPYTNGW